MQKTTFYNVILLSAILCFGLLVLTGCGKAGEPLRPSDVKTSATYGG